MSAHRARQPGPRISVLIANGAASASTNSCSTSVAPGVLPVVKKARRSTATDHSELSGHLHSNAPVFEAQVRREAVMSYASAPRACSLTWATAHNWFTEMGSPGSTPEAQRATRELCALLAERRHGLRRLAGNQQSARRYRVGLSLRAPGRVTRLTYIVSFGASGFAAQAPYFLSWDASREITVVDLASGGVRVIPVPLFSDEVRTG